MTYICFLCGKGGFVSGRDVSISIGHRVEFFIGEICDECYDEVLDKGVHAITGRIKNPLKLGDE